MKRSLSARLNAYLAIQTLMEASKTIVAVLPALETAVEALVDFILAINLNIKIQASPSGAAEAKKDARIAVGDAAFEVAGGVLAYADENSDHLLVAKVKFSRSDITIGAGHLVVGRIQGIIDAATANLDALSDQGVTPEKLKALKQLLKAYDLLRALPRNAIGAASAATKALDRLFPQVDRLLDNRIDRLMWQFRGTAREFYDKYQSARTIVDAPSPSADAKAAEAKAAGESAPTLNGSPSTVTNPVSSAPANGESNGHSTDVRNGSPDATAEARSA